MPYSYQTAYPSEIRHLFGPSLELFNHPSVGPQFSRVRIQSERKKIKSSGEVQSKAEPQRPRPDAQKIRLNGKPKHVCDIEELPPRDIQRLELLEEVGGLIDNPNKPS